MKEGGAAETIEVCAAVHGGHVADTIAFSNAVGNFPVGADNEKGRFSDLFIHPVAHHSDVPLQSSCSNVRPDTRVLTPKF